MSEPTKLNMAFANGKNETDANSNHTQNTNDNTTKTIIDITQDNKVDELTQQTNILRIVENKIKSKDNNDNEIEDSDANVQPIATIDPKLVNTLATKLVSHGTHTDYEITDEQAFEQVMAEVELEETQKQLEEEQARKAALALSKVQDENKVDSQNQTQSKNAASNLNVENTKNDENTDEHTAHLRKNNNYRNVVDIIKTNLIEEYKTDIKNEGKTVLLNNYVNNTEALPITLEFTVPFSLIYEARFDKMDDVEQEIEFKHLDEFRSIWVLIMYLRYLYYTDSKVKDEIVHKPDVYIMWLFLNLSCESDITPLYDMYNEFYEKYYATYLSDNTFAELLSSNRILFLKQMKILLIASAKINQRFIKHNYNELTEYISVMDERYMHYKSQMMFGELWNFILVTENTYYENYAANTTYEPLSDPENVWSTPVTKLNIAAEINGITDYIIEDNIQSRQQPKRRRIVTITQNRNENTNEKHENTKTKSKKHNKNTNATQSQSTHRTSARANEDITITTTLATGAGGNPDDGPGDDDDDDNNDDNNNNDNNGNNDESQQRNNSQNNQSNHNNANGNGSNGNSNNNNDNNDNNNGQNNSNNNNNNSNNGQNSQQDLNQALTIAQTLEKASKAFDKINDKIDNDRKYTHEVNSHKIQKEQIIKKLTSDDIDCGLKFRGAVGMSEIWFTFKEKFEDWKQDHPMIAQCFKDNPKWEANVLTKALSGKALTNKRIQREIFTNPEQFWKWIVTYYAKPYDYKNMMDWIKEKFELPATMHCKRWYAYFDIYRKRAMLARDYAYDHDKRDPMTDLKWNDIFLDKLPKDMVQKFKRWLQDGAIRIQSTLDTRKAIAKWVISETAMAEFDVKYKMRYCGLSNDTKIYPKHKIDPTNIGQSINYVKSTGKSMKVKTKDGQIMTAVKAGNSINLISNNGKNSKSKPQVYLPKDKFNNKKAKWNKTPQFIKIRLLRASINDIFCPFECFSCHFKGHFGKYCNMLWATDIPRLKQLLARALNSRLAKPQRRFNQYGTRGKRSTRGRGRGRYRSYGSRKPRFNNNNNKPFYNNNNNNYNNKPFNNNGRGYPRNSQNSRNRGRGQRGNQRGNRGRRGNRGTRGYRGNRSNYGNYNNYGNYGNNNNNYRNNGYNNNNYNNNNRNNNNNNNGNSNYNGNNYNSSNNISSNNNNNNNNNISHNSSYGSTINDNINGNNQSHNINYSPNKQRDLDTISQLNNSIANLQSLAHRANVRNMSFNGNNSNQSNFGGSNNSHR